MVRPSRAPVSRPSEAPRAKALARELGVSPALVRAAEKYEEAAAAFDVVVLERHGSSEIDERYADLAATAGEVLRAFIEDRTRAVLGEPLVAAIAPYERDRKIGEAPEDDIVVAERIGRELRGRSKKKP